MIPDILGWERALPYLVAAFVGGYAVGSIPFGLYVTRMFGLGDVREIGSGNIGATNVLRTGNKVAAAATLVLDLLKGLLPTLLAAEWGPLASAAAGAGAGIGHCLPIWLRFRGGKGVATSFGVLIGWNWASAALAVLVWLILLLLFRYVSLASIVGALAAPVALAYYEEWDFMPAALVITVLVIARHTPNIRRLFLGSESKLRFGSASGQQDTRERSNS